ncbi:MAG: ADOP family duplicated permease [Gemmatimonadaceae bacterium]
MRWNRWARRARPDADFGEEIRAHIELEAEQLRAEGWGAEAARDEARRRFGNVAGAQERFYESRRVLWLDALARDVRFALRQLRRAPLFALLAVLTLALGIGANAAVFGVVKSVLLDALPYRDADRLVRVYSRFAASEMERSSVSPGAAADIDERARSFSSVASFNFSTFDVAFLGDAGARVLAAAFVTPDYFSTLGVHAALGRTLTAADATSNAALLSHDAWQREFGGDSSVVGRTLRIERSAAEVVGVLPADYVGPMGAADIVFPLDLKAILRGGASARDQHWLGVVGRLAPGASAETAKRELDRLAADLEREHPQTDRGRSLVVVPLRDSMVGETRTPLLLLMTSAGLVLLITCANLAGALLSRTIARRREFAVRVALGAGSGRLVRQLLTETTLLAMLGAVVGLALALLGLAAVRTFARSALPPYADLSLDPGAVLVTLLAALLVGVGFGLAPALSAARRQPQGTLREEGRATSEGRRARGLRGALVATQLALSLSLLAGAGMLVRSLLAIANAPLGFTPDGVLTARVELPAASYATPQARNAVFQELHERLAAQPGVLAVASVTQIPSTTMSQNKLTIEGVTLAGEGPTFIPYMSVSDDYFRLMGIGLVEGRVFGPQDGPDAPPAIIVSQAMARRYWPRGAAVGSRIRISPHTAERWGVVVGVVRDVRVDPALPTPGPMAYATNRQDDMWGGRDFLVRTQGDPLAVLPAMRRLMAAIDPAVPLRAPTTLRAIVDERLVGRRLPVLLLTAFGALALVLASVGVYAMFASMAAAREREFGVRLALGSTPRGIAALVLRQGAAWMALGLAGGALGVLLVARTVRGLLYGVSPFDPVALALAVLLLAVCGAAALLVPVRRAASVDPNVALRAG